MLELVTNFFAIYPVPQTFAEFIPYMFTLFIELMLVLAVFKVLGYVMAGIVSFGSGRTRL